ncbi:ribosomal protein S21/MRP21 [Phanerochaete sordida]|uniref:Ribosomal protein S21/MRP21 n=1 Tax=Phanerochaete sordida TaxID=48140 RepID=A0A9P3GKF2_9APHY|nr:ribosomal protein S21/MRP21 [Phanerochaete sordida]
MLAALSRSSQATLRRLHPSPPRVLAAVRAYAIDPRFSLLNLRNIPNPAAPTDEGWRAVRDAVNTNARSPEEIWASREPTVNNLNRPNGPFIGRSAYINPQTSLGQAYTKLRNTIRSNNLFREVKLQARHEKKGYKRRRLESERWRRRFAHEVRMKIQIVKEIRARGA